MFSKRLDNLFAQDRYGTQRLRYDHGGVEVTLSISSFSEEGKAGFQLRYPRTFFYETDMDVRNRYSVKIDENGKRHDVEFKGEDILFMTNNLVFLYRPEFDTTLWHDHLAEFNPEGLDKWWKELQPKIMIERLRL